MTAIVRFLRELKRLYSTISRQTPRFSETRDINAPQSRDMKMASRGQQDVVKRGLRRKKYETVQLYFCHHLRVILEGLSLYNIRYSMEEVCQRIKEQFGLDLKTSTISDWVKEFGSICRYTRLRPYGLKLYSREQAVQTVHLFHRQVYDFSVHRAKLALTLQALQRFMLCNDSVTVATEVPVHMDYMEECNKTIVYLKQIRDIFGDDVEGV